jgi:GT2 family glycosyltransferase/glycosyltransferase involved in cell wall biosynthesis
LSKRSQLLTSLLGKARTATRIVSRQPSDLLPLLLQNLKPSKHRIASTSDRLRAEPETYAGWISANEQGAYLPSIARSESVISIILVADAANEHRVNETIESLRRQSHPNWKAYVVRVADQRSAIQRASAAIRRTTWRSKQVVDLKIHDRGAALAYAVSQATSDFIMILDPGDLLARHAIAAIAAELTSNPDVDILHADEDVWLGEVRITPRFKPEWSPELLASYYYFGRPTALRRSTVLQSGNFATDLGDATEWDLALRVTRKFFDQVRTPKVRRLPMILCHRRSKHDPSRPTPDDPRSAFFRNAVKRHWARFGTEAEVTTQADGTQHATWIIWDPPLVSIIVPNRNHARYLRACIDGIRHRTNYPRTELIIVDNNSTDPETLVLYRLAEAEGARIVPIGGSFNYSRACNRGADIAQGDLLLFLNNDVEMRSSDWLCELVRHAMRPGVGVVGAQLLYPSGDIQHAGVVIGLQAFFGHVFNKSSNAGWGIIGSPSVARNWLGLTGACQLLRRDVFERLGRYDESFELVYSDIALCLVAWRAGYRNIYAAKAQLLHHEGASRGAYTPEADTTRIALRIRALGIEDDPYFHPGLSALSTLPVLRLADVPSVRVNLKNAIDHFAPHVSRYDTDLDLCDDGAVADAADLPVAQILWNTEMPDTTGDVYAAARLIIDLLRRRMDLRQRFPHALIGGKDGPFGQWLMGEGATLFGFNSKTTEMIGGALEFNLAGRARQVALYDEALRQASPLFLLPPGRRCLAARLFRASATGVIRLEEVWWTLMESAEKPASELVLTWLVTPEWQARFPEGVAISGREPFADWLRRDLCLEADWLDPRAWPAPLPPIKVSSADDYPNDLDTLKMVGVNVFGHFSYPSGLRTSAKNLVASLTASGINTSLRDVPVSLALDEPGFEHCVGIETFEATIIHVQPNPFFSNVFPRSGLHERTPRTYRIGYWYWESSEVPSAWDSAVEQCDEVWTATDFVRTALRRRYDKPVYVLPPGLELPMFELLPRRHFELPERPFVFLFVFHMTSVMERKNPLGLISAFRKAFNKADDAMLIIKTTFGDQHPAELAALRSAAAGSSVQILDGVFSQAETLSLMAQADAYVSLHRSEGFGLTMLEAMLLGKPVIATGYSGNLDFMNNDNSLLVEYKIVTLERDLPNYPRGLQWAHPSIDHAAALMRHLYENQSFSRELGTRAQEEMRETMIYRKAGARMANRLSIIAQRRTPALLQAHGTAATGVGSAHHPAAVFFPRPY